LRDAAEDNHSAGAGSDTGELSSKSSLDYFKIHLQALAGIIPDLEKELPCEVFNNCRRTLSDALGKLEHLVRDDISRSPLLQTSDENHEGINQSSVSISVPRRHLKSR